ncbi:MAG: response regulator [Alphaproteobacteria bacterium]|nr:response regulator [Alphaproteobacteria bacterium]
MHVLIVDDEELVRGFLTSVLASAGYEVAAAADGVEGLAEISRRCPDIILCDRLMPRMSGHEMLEIIRRDWRSLDEVPFLFLSVLSDQRDFDTVSDLRPTSYLTKPIRKNELLQALAGIVGAARSGTA